MHLLQPMKVSDGRIGALDPRDGVEGEVGLPGKVVEGKNVVVEH